MPNVKKEIKFNKSMTADKRNENFAYLRKNVLPTKTEGLYPSKDFIDMGIDIPTGYDVADIVGSGVDEGGGSRQIKAILVNRSSPNNVIFRHIYTEGTYSPQNNPLPAGVRYITSAYGSDGIYVLGNDKNVYCVQSLNVNTNLVGALNDPVYVNVGGWDGKFYWWAGTNGIWQQLPGAAGTRIMTTIGQTILKMDFLNSQMVLAYQSGADIGILLWDKKDTALFEKKIIVKNSRYLAMGVVDGTLILVRSVGNSANAKEYEGEIVIAGYDGENFKTLNSIRAGRIDVGLTNGFDGTNCDTGSEIMIFSVYQNYRAGVNQDLGQNYIYKVKKDGSIEVQYLPETLGIYNFTRVARIFYDFTLFAVDNNTVGESSKIYSNQDTRYRFSDYPTYNKTEYITPFLCNPFNYHKLEGFSVTFEKMFKNTESATTPPSVYPTEITVSNLLFTTLTLGWTKASDAVTAQADLEYSVYKSSTGNIDTISDITTNGTKIKDWTKDIATFNVTGLTDDTDNYFNILVRDGAGNMAKYDMIMVHTYLTSLVTAWTNPTANGIVVSGGVDHRSFVNPTNVYAEDGTFAVGTNVGNDRVYQTYYGFGTVIPSGSTLVGLEIRVVGKADTDRQLLVILCNEIDNLSVGKTDETKLGYGSSLYVTTSNTEYLIGSPTKLFNDMTESKINASTFGLVLKCNGYDAVHSVDNLQIKAFYTI